MRHLEQKMRDEKNSRRSNYAKIFSALFFTLSASLKSFSGNVRHLEQKMRDEKNSRRSNYAKIFSVLFFTLSASLKSFSENVRHLEQKMRDDNVDVFSIAFLGALK